MCTLFQLDKRSLLPFKHDSIRKQRNRAPFTIHGSLNWFQIDDGIFAVEDGLSGVNLGESYTLPDTMHSDYDQSEKSLSRID